MKRLFAIFLCVCLLLVGCAQSAPAPSQAPELKQTGALPLVYARHFSVDTFEGGYQLITLSDGSQFMTIPEGMEIPSGVGNDVTILRQPIGNIYLAATSVMCLFDALDSLDTIRLSGTKADGWYVDNARKEMEAGNILFAGKYSEPDYELLLSENCALAIESRMITHVPDVQEKLDELGIPVLMDQSGLEDHPLGRLEWIKLYGVLLNQEEAADAIFRQQMQHLTNVQEAAPTGKTASFFYITPSGKVVARKSDDYVSKMIQLAGGQYVFEHLGEGENDLSTVTIDMEAFFATAKDADFIIYNSTIGGEVESLEALLDKNELLKEFRAVQNGNVWCTGKNMYQETTGMGEMIQSFHSIFSGEADTLDQVPYLYRLR